jgi:hypothetical protein
VAESAAHHAANDFADNATARTVKNMRPSIRVLVVGSSLLAVFYVTWVYVRMVQGKAFMREIEAFFELREVAKAVTKPATDTNAVGRSYHFSSFEDFTDSVRQYRPLWRVEPESLNPLPDLLPESSYEVWTTHPKVNERILIISGTVHRRPIGSIRLALTISGEVEYVGLVD